MEIQVLSTGKIPVQSGTISVKFSNSSSHLVGCLNLQAPLQPSFHFKSPLKNDRIKVMKAGKLLNRTIFTVLSLHLISACQTGRNPELVTEKPTIASYYQRADWEGMIPPSPPIPIPVPNIECREKTVTLPPGTLTHPKYKYLNINICRRVRPPYTDEDKRDKLTL